MKMYQISILIIFFISSVVAQSSSQIGLNLGINKIETSSFGGSINYTRSITNQFYFTSSGGYYSWGSGNDMIGILGFQKGISATGMVFLAVGGKYYFSEQTFRPYLSVEWEMDAYLNAEKYAEIITIDDDENMNKEYVTLSKQHPGVKIAFGWTFGINQRMYDKLDFDAAVAYRIGVDFTHTLRFTVGILYNI